MDDLTARLDADLDMAPPASRASADAAQGARGRRSLWQRVTRIRSARIALLIVAAYVAIALLANIIAPYDPTQGSLLDRLQLPSSAHPLGTDAIGRDTLSRIIYGARISLIIEVGAVALGAFVGVTWGLVAGYLGGWVDEVSMRVVDVMLAFPGILLAIAIVAVLGGGLTNVILAVGISSIPAFARLTRGVVLATRDLEYVEAGRLFGESPAAILVRYLLPAARGPLVVLASLRMATSLLAAASLGFLGLGVTPPTPEWGAMLSGAQSYMAVAPWVAAMPGIAIALVVLAFNLLGDGMRDALDVRLAA